MIARKVVCRMTKREARAWAKARRAELDMAAVGRGMAQALFSLPQWQRAGAVLAFAAMPDEPDTAEILKHALADGKRLLLPRVRSKTEMDWVEIPALCLLRPGAFGIQEPPADLPAADPKRVKQEIEDILAIPAEDAPEISAKQGINIDAVLEDIVQNLPCPQGDPNAPLQALIFDSYYDAYRGVIVYMRLKQGTINPGMEVKMMATGATFKVLE